MPRRRKKNTLLTRIFIVSLLVHAIALPIAAHFGVFDKVKQQFGSSRVVMINVPPEKERERAEKREKKQTKKSRQTTKKGPSAPHRSGPRRTAKPNPFQPKVIAGGSDQGNGEGGPTVDANGTGRAGVVPTGPATPPALSPPPPAEATPKTTKPALEPTPVETAEKTAVTRAVPASLKFTQVETTYAPEPVIPDDLRTESFEKTLVVEADVSVSGAPENIKVVSSTGVKELDDIGIDTAKQYKFKPATLGDDAVEGHVRFQIIFKVE